ncbi:MAG: replication restart helicase PriA [Acidobacteriaceae bacterium]
MSSFCEVALPVPLDRTFTYSVSGHTPAVGGRVLVAFAGQKLMGVVTRLHDDPPPVEAKPLQLVVDLHALLPDELMRLAEWIAQYYVAPLGEVLRGMLPLMAEVKRETVYRMTEAGRLAFSKAASSKQQSVMLGSGSSAARESWEQNREMAVLEYLLHRAKDNGTARLSTLKSAVKASPQMLEGMVRRKWLTREAVALSRDARRREKVAVLVENARLPKLNDNQTAILAELAGVGGRMALNEVRRLQVPQTTLATLVKRGLVRIDEVPAEFVMSSLPASGRKHTHEHTLNPAQNTALHSITASLTHGGFRPHLLYGVTGSGKTAVYLAAMQRALEAEKSAILLVPEIGLTPAMVGQMHAAFGDHVALLHSALTPDERAEQWHRIRRGEARIVVGTRSAVFAPVVDLGLLIVDEEHDSSYKQEETPRYHGRDVAVMRAKLNGATVVLGSATPSLESWANAERGKYARIELLERVMDRPLPAVELVDMRKEFQETGQEQLFSRSLITETQATLDRGEQAIILLNRRGYSFVVLCRSCGDKLECENCAIALTYHKPVAGSDLHAHVGQRLECHYCGYKRTVPKVCPKCESEHLYFLGAGSQQGEERLQEIFPGARIGRMDRDTVRGRSDMERLLSRLHSGEINLLVGTQMIAKGHDIHGVTLVGVVGADFALGLPDFRAAERVFQLLTQVAGRAGRGELPGKVVVQTYHPDHYAIQFAAKHDYTGFVAKELNYRRWMHYPPNAVLANIILQSTKLEEATKWASILGRWFQKTPLNQIRVLGPAAAPIVRLKRVYRYHFVLKAQQKQALGTTLRAMLAHAASSGIPARNIVIDVDAVHLM